MSGRTRVGMGLWPFAALLVIGIVTAFVISSLENSWAADAEATTGTPVVPVAPATTATPSGEPTAAATPQP